jgi:hypothetical protein
MNRNKAAGTRWESAIVEFLRDNGFPWAERRALAGALDKGDVTGIPGVVIEAKAHRQISLAEFLDEALTERDNAGAQIGAAWVKRKGKGSAGDGYVVMDGHTFALLLRAAGWGEGL